MDPRGSQPRPPRAPDNDEADQYEDPEEMDPRDFQRHGRPPPLKKSVTYDGITAQDYTRTNIGSVGESKAEAENVTYKNIVLKDYSTVNLGHMSDNAFRDFTSPRAEPRTQTVPPQADAQRPWGAQNRDFRTSGFPGRPNPDYNSRPVPSSGPSAQQWASQGRHGVPTNQFIRVNTLPALSDSERLCGDGSDADLVDRLAEGRPGPTVSFGHGFHHLSSNVFNKGFSDPQDRR